MGTIAKVAGNIIVFALCCVGTVSVYKKVNGWRKAAHDANNSQVSTK